MSDETTTPFPKKRTVLSEQSRFWLTPAALVGLIATAWLARGEFEAFRNEQREAQNKTNIALVDIARTIEARTADRFTATSMREWGFDLERANRDVQRSGGQAGLIVPAVRASVP